MGDEGATVDAAAETGDDDLSALLSSATLMLFIGSLGSLSRLFERVVIGRLLSPSAFGQVEVSFSVMTIATTVALFGFREGIPRFMTRFESDENARGAWFTGSAVALVLAVGTTVALFTNAEWVGVQFEEQVSTELLSLFVLTIPFFAGLQLAVAGIRGRENTIYRTYTRDLLYNGLRLGLIVSLLLAGYGVVAVGYAYLASAAVALVVALWLFNRLLPIRGAFRTRTREMVVFSLPLVLASVSSILLGRVDSIMIGYYLPIEQAGIYGAAWPLARTVSVIVSSFGFLFLPLMSRLDAGGQRGEVNRLYKVTTKWVFVVSFPVLLCLVVFADDLLLAAFGNEYTAGATALAVLALGSFTSASFGRCQDTLSAFGYTTDIFDVNAVAAVLNLALNAALIPGYGPLPGLGLEGAAAATAISTVVLNGSALATLWYKSGVNPFSRVTVRTFALLPVVFFLPAVALDRVVTLGLVGLIAFVAVVGIASIAVLALTGSLQSEDEIPFDLVEDRLGVTIPLIRRYIPDADSSEGIDTIIEANEGDE
jgi:O-antigen/teichoic acid export membrane protein